jgi:hypothetical protein
MQAAGSFGKWLLFFGIGSLVLNLISMEFIILAWIDLWGPETGWLIRMGMIGVGAILWIASKLAPASTVEDAEDDVEAAPADGVA